MMGPIRVYHGVTRAWSGFWSFMSGGLRDSGADGSGTRLGILCGSLFESFEAVPLNLIASALHSGTSG